MRKPVFLLLPLLIFGQCTDSNPPVDTWKEEIVQAEHDFAKMASEVGIQEAFVAFAADDAVLQRDRTVVEGIEAIKKRFEQSTPNPRNKLEWKPDFVDVAASGDLGYTYGKYVSTTYDSLGNERVSRGIFHTVWKRQKDGSWKYVWD